MKKYLIALSISIFLFSCGGSDNAKPEKLESMPETTEEAAPAEANEMAAEESSEETEEVATDENMTVVTIEGNDQMKFNLSEIKVPAGKEVKLILKHVGKLDANVMGHNWVLVKNSTDLNAFAAAATTAKETGYIPNEGKDVIANTSVIGGGEQTEVTFMAPEAGEYTFLCSFPGHFAMMQGKFIVE